MDSAGDLDRISALPDDLLHLILAYVGDAIDVTRTAVLSRRWRRVWIHAQGLVLVDKTKVYTNEPDRFADFVDWVFAQRDNADIGSLEISMPGWRRACATKERLNQWLCYAMQHVVKSFNIQVPHYYESGRWLNELWNQGYGINKEPTIELPERGRMNSIRMYLSRCRLQLPMAAAAKYEALTYFELNSVLFDEKPGGRRALGDFVSSCCPRLRKLCIYFPERLPQLVLRNEALEELKLYYARDMQTLDVTAPNLRVLYLARCFDNNVAKKAAKVSAKRLEKIVADELKGVELQIRDLTSVRCLSPINLYMHGRYIGRDRDSGFRLLNKCTGVEHVKVLLGHWEPSNAIEGELVDLLTYGGKPFANAKSMEMDVRAHEFPKGHLVASMSSLLLRFPHLRSLCIKIIKTDRDPRDCSCSTLDTWKNITSNSLEEVKISDFRGANEDIDLVSLLFASSNSIKSMTISCTKKRVATISLARRMAAEVDDNGTETVDQKLMNIPSTNRGRWDFENYVYTWTIETATPVCGEGSSANSI